MKIASPDIPHKSDIHGVVLDVQNAGQAASAYTQLMARVKEKLPAARDRRRLGADADSRRPGCDRGRRPRSQLRTPVMFGSGGVEAEGLGDVAFALAPLEPSEADDLMRRTWAGRRLDGFRNIPAGR